MICAPIFADGEKFGVIHAANKNAVNGDGDSAFTEMDIFLLQFVASVVGISIKAKRDTLVYAEQLFKSVTDQAYSLLNADRISIFAYDKFSKNLMCLISQDIRGLSIPVDSGLVGSSFKLLQTINSSNIMTDCRHNTSFDEKYGYEPGSSLCAPIFRLDGKPIGVVQALRNSAAVETFSEIDESKMMDICSRSGVILQKIVDIDEIRYLTGKSTSAASIMSQFVEELSSLPEDFIVGFRVRSAVKDFGSLIECLKDNMNFEDTLIDPLLAGNLLGATSRFSDEDLFSWDFDSFQVETKNEIRCVTRQLVTSIFDLEELRISPAVFEAYLCGVQKNYNENPFHNFRHALCVTHFTCMLSASMKAREKLGLVQHFAVVFSAIVHDLDHPGNTNIFEINSGSPRALLYNDTSVLENYHCSSAFHLMVNKGGHLLENFSQSDKSDFRKMVISCILATDMSVHYQLIDEFKKKTSTETWDVASSPAERLFLGKILVHAADLSNPVREFAVTRKWAQCISDEFNQQVDKEVAMGLPVLAFMITKNEETLCKNEMFFNSFVVAPMWQAIAGHFGGLDHLIVQLNENLSSWKLLSDDLAGKPP